MPILNPTVYPGQQHNFEAVKALHPDAVLIRVADEKSGQRFGKSAKRAGMAVKIGGGGRNRGCKTGAYQLWASWAPCDLQQSGQE